MKLFQAMTIAPWPFVFVLPSIMIVLAAVGWSQTDIIENNVANIWTRSNGGLARDKEYADSVGKGFATTSSFAAMAIARDEDTLLTSSRLEEIRARMEAAENTTINYKGVTYSWEDLCASNNLGPGTTYEFPCARISPMDLYQEARWFFKENDRVTWYDEAIRKSLVKPRLPRFGVMQGVCSSAGGATSQSNACDHILALRQNVTYAVENGFPPEYANPLSLFADIGGIEINNPCAICIEQGFESTIETLTVTITAMFQVIYAELGRYRRDGGLTDPAQLAQLDGLINQMGFIASTMSREKVEEFYSYYVVRTLYAQLGASAYVPRYAAFMASLKDVCAGVSGNPAACPATVTVQQAMGHLFQHADNTFSSVTTAGSPFPFWDKGDGTGSMFQGTSPVGGSGINLGGTLLSSAAYLDLVNVRTPSSWRPLYTTGPYMDPITPDPNWAAYVETDPVYRWFVAEVTPMTSHCGNGFLTGTQTGNAQVDAQTGAAAAGLLTQEWCTKYNVPFEQDGTYTQQHFAKMWYDLLLDSPSFLGITKGESDPYTWTTGQGCDYVLRGQRYAYTNQTKEDIASNSSRLLYYIDEGVSVGAIDRNLLIGGVTPPIGKYDYANPIQKVTVMQSLYLMNAASAVPDRVQNCNRPGGPVEITTEDAEEIVFKFKEAFEDNWVKGWDNPNDGSVQFVGFFDDQGGAIGTTGRLLEEITLDNGLLMAISIVVIVVFSVVFLFSFNVIESRVLLTLFGVGLVLVSFFAALGLGILLGIKVNVNIAWTLPFIILGLGVDDMYIVMLALKKQRDYSTESFLEGMMEVVVPVTMTSLVNASMFAIMNIVDIPAVYKTAQMALLAVIFLYLTIVFAFPAYCYLDMKRQEAGRRDVLVCLQKDDEAIEENLNRKRTESGSGAMYDYLYKPLLLSDSPLRFLSQAVIILAGLALFGVGVYGITDRSVGLGLEDFFPDSHQAKKWATVRTSDLSSWTFGMNWGEVDYGNPDTQMGIISQFEGVAGSKYVAEVDTKALWIADFAVWTTRQCSANFDRADPLVKECGRDQVYPVDNSTCSGYWTYNKLGLRQKNFGDGITCVPNEGGICRPTNEMHPSDLIDLGINPLAPTNLTASWCPVFSGWTDDKLAFCLRQWSNFTGGGGDFITKPGSDTENPACTGEFYSDAEIEMPIKFSRGPTMFTFGLVSHEETLNMIDETRSVCDDDDSIHCWLLGIPFDYWEQYLWVEDVLLQLSAAAIGLGFIVSVIFLFSKLTYEGNHGAGQNFVGSVVGAGLIAISTTMSLIPVIGISVLAGVNLTAFSDMSFVLSVGFAVEYSVHVVHRFLEAPWNLDNALDRVDYAMSFLSLPTFMSFISSLIGVICLAFTEFEFNKVFFFRPLIIVMFVTYFYGCWFLPVVLTMLNFEFLRLGAPGIEEEEQKVEDGGLTEQPIDEMKA